MGQALRKFELVEACASGSAIAPEERIAEPIAEPLRNLGSGPINPLEACLPA